MLNVYIHILCKQVVGLLNSLSHLQKYGHTRYFRSFIDAERSMLYLMARYMNY